MITVWLTSDQHFGHANIIRHCNRPFSDVYHMNEEIIQNYCSVVGPDDVVYHLGDFTLNNPNKYLDRLPGKLILITGNHDKKPVRRHPRWEAVYDYLEINHNKKKIVLFHYPIESWRSRWRESIHFHGHSHGRSMKVSGRFDVGVDCHQFMPVKMDKAIQMVEAERVSLLEAKCNSIIT
jgi:calcineurin-like phosphoesterase family protein